MSKAMSSDPITPSPRVEVITSVQRRRRWSTAEKVRLVEEAMQPGSSVSFVARRYAISPSLLFTWKRRMLEGGPRTRQMTSCTSAPPSARNMVTTAGSGPTASGVSGAPSSRCTMRLKN